MAYELPEDQTNDEERIALAVGEIAKSPNLRFLIRGLLLAFGHGQTPEGGNALETARAIGRHSAGSDIIATLTTSRPELYPNLLLEDIAEEKDSA